MKDLGMRRGNGGGRRRGLFGIALGAALTACVVMSASVRAGPTNTITTSTTCHTNFGCPARSETSTTTTSTFGPDTILIGEKQSQTFFVAAGTVNVNTNTHTETFVCTATGAPALAPAGLAGFAILLAGYGIRRLGRPSGSSERQRACSGGL